MSQQLRRRFTLGLAILFASRQARSEGNADERKQRILRIERTATPETLDRKRRSETVLRAEGVRVNVSLPSIQSEATSRRRSTSEVAFRAMALLAIAARGEGVQPETVNKIIQQYGLQPALSPKELRFLSSTQPSQQDLVQFSWRYEAAWVLLWALGYVEKLAKPASMCDAPKAVAFMRERTAKQFISSATLRPQAKLLDWADLAYRYHWAVTEARVRGGPAPSVDAGVVLEWHYTLNWLIGYMEQPWDEISTDT